ncbi:MAG: TonB-dependent receptor [Gemmatimonadota bacterium]|nr:TonB-dependent receptor [Gemmatimonadota bacterium]
MLIRHTLTAIALAVGAVAIVAAPTGAQEQQESFPLDSLLSIPVSAAVKYQQSTQDAPASVSIITRDQFSRFGFRTVGEALTQLRGFYGSYDRNYFYLGIRGFSRPTDYNNRVLLMLNGHVLNENFYNSAFVGTTLGISLDVVDRIEVVRGPGSALHGGGAMLAVVNVITKSSTSSRGLDFTAEVGSFGLRGGTATLIHQFPSGPEITIMASGTDASGADLYFPEFDEPRTNDGIATELDWDRGGGVLGVARFREFTFSVLKTSRKKGIPTAAWEMVFNDDSAFTLDERAFAELKWNRDLNTRANLEVRGYYDWYSYDGFYPYEPPDGVWVDGTDARWFGGETRLRWDPTPTDRIVIGAEYRKTYRAEYRSWDNQDEYFNDDLPFTNHSVFVQNEWQTTQQLSLTLGLRYDSYSDVVSAVTPRAALVFHPSSRATAKLLYGRAFRAPTRWEQYYEEEDVWKTNPALEPEKIRTVEAIWEQRVSDGVWATAGVFDYEMTDLIDESVDPVDDLSLYQNVSTARVTGAEFEIRTRLPSGFGGYASYVFQKARLVGSDEVLTNSPQHLFRAGAYQHFPHGVTLAANVSYDHERRTVQDTMLDPFFLVDATVSKTALHDRLRASLSVRNLLNASYQTPGGFEHVQPGIQQDGRHVRLTATAHF